MEQKDQNGPWSVKRTQSSNKVYTIFLNYFILEGEGEKSEGDTSMTVVIIWDAELSVTDWVYHFSSDIRNFICHITYYSPMLSIAYGFKEQAHIFEKRV